MIVYRFERNGIGPFAGPYRGPFRTDTKSKKTRTIIKAEEIAAREAQMDNSSFKAWDYAHSRSEYLYGCKSKAQLRAYFHTFKELFRQGYRIKRYVVPDIEVIDMGTQVAFPVRYHKLQTVKKVKELSNRFY